MFRTLGLRHLVITNHDNQVVGIVTRSDLAATQEQPVDADSARPFTSSGSRGSKGVDAAAVTLLRDDSMRRFSPDDDFEDEAGL